MNKSRETFSKLNQEKNQYQYQYHWTTISSHHILWNPRSKCRNTSKREHYHRRLRGILLLLHERFVLYVLTYIHRCILIIPDRYDVMEHQRRHKDTTIKHVDTRLVTSLFFYSANIIIVFVIFLTWLWCIIILLYDIIYTIRSLLVKWGGEGGLWCTTFNNISVISWRSILLVEVLGKGTTTNII